MSKFNFGSKLDLSRAQVFAIIMGVAFLAFEIFNASTTYVSLDDLLGSLSFLGISWSLLLTIAFCGIDFAGIARLFTPETGDQEPAAVWYLFGAWVLAAVFNATLTWWGVAIALKSNATRIHAPIELQSILTIMPIALAMLTWLIRILLITSFSSMADRALHGKATQRPFQGQQGTPQRPIFPDRSQSTTLRPATPPQPFRGQIPGLSGADRTQKRPEPIYKPLLLPEDKKD